MRRLKHYLASPPPGYAFLMRGAWGAGKSHCWSSYVNTEIPLTSLKAITMSAAGLQSSDDLERTLFQASIQSSVSKLVSESGSVIGRAALRWLKIEPNEITLSAAMTTGTTVICIDDMERFDGPFSALFGFIVNLLDANGLHVVLIADEGKAFDKFPDYSSYKERIIARSQNVVPDIEGFIDAQIKSLTTRSSRDSLHAIAPKMVRTFADNDLHNLRTVRSIIIELDVILQSIPQQQKIMPAGRIFSAVAFWMIAVSKDSSNTGLVARAFSTDNLGIVLAMHEQSGARNATAGKEPNRLMDFLISTKSARDAYDWPKSESFVNLIMDRDVDYQLLSKDFGINNESTLDKIEDPLDSIAKFRQMESETLRAHINLLFTEIEFQKSKSIDRIFEVYRALNYLVRKRLTRFSEKELVEITLQSIESFPVEALTQDNLEVWLADGESFDPRVLPALQGLSDRFSENKKSNWRISAINWIADQNGEMPDPIEGPIFIKANPHDFFQRLLRSGASAVMRTARIFGARMKIANSPAFVGEDSEFAQQLAEIVDYQIPREGMLNVLESELADLSKTLKAFVEFVKQSK